MAFPVVASTSPIDTSGSINIPVRSAGDMILLIQPLVRASGTGTKTLTIGALDGVTWNLVGSVAGNGTTTYYFIVYYLFAGAGGSATTVSLSADNGWIQVVAGTTLRITGTHPSTAPEGSFTTGIDPPLLDPAGWGTEDTLWLAAGIRFGGSSVTTDPSGYTSVDTNYSRVASRNNTASSEDPGAFSGGSGNGTVATLAIRPSSLVIPNMVSLYHQMRRRKS